MITLGIHVSFNGTSHDSSASIIINKSVVAACEEERFNRQKSSQLFFPHKSIKFCLNDYENCRDDGDCLTALTRRIEQGPLRARGLNLSSPVDPTSNMIVVDCICRVGKLAVGDDCGRVWAS
mgnify:CR=1 FL=1